MLYYGCCGPTEHLVFEFASNIMEDEQQGMNDT